MAEQGVHAKFFKKAVLNGVESKKAGRQVFEDKDYIEITVAGMDKEIHVAPVNDSHRARFPTEWERYAKGADQNRVGTPIREWPQLTPSMVARLESFNVFTVEDMATLSDAGISQIGMGARKLQQDAQRFISLAQSAADLARLEEIEGKLKAKDELIARQSEQLTEQGAQIAELRGQMERLLAAQQPEEPAPRKRKQQAEA